MSGIPKSKRSESKLEALHRVYKVRKKLMEELFLTFALDGRRLEKRIEEYARTMQGTEDLDIVRKYITGGAKDFINFTIEHSRKNIFELCMKLARTLRAANTIWPSYASEFEDRRAKLTEALCICNELQEEIQFIADILPTDKNRYMQIVLDIEEIFKMVKELRRSDKRFLDDVRVNELVLHGYLEDLSMADRAKLRKKARDKKLSDGKRQEIGLGVMSGAIKAEQVPGLPEILDQSELLEDMSNGRDDNPNWDYSGTDMPIPDFRSSEEIAKGVKPPRSSHFSGRKNEYAKRPDLKRFKRAPEIQDIHSTEAVIDKSVVKAFLGDSPSAEKSSRT